MRSGSNDVTLKTESILKFLFSEKDNKDEFSLDKLNLSRHEKSINLSNSPSVAEIENHLAFLEQLQSIFPTVLIPINAETKLKSNLKNKLLFKLKSISYFVSANKYIQFSSVKFSPLAVHLQFIQLLTGDYPQLFSQPQQINCVSDIYARVIEFEKTENEPLDLNNSLGRWLISQIRQGYSKGELFDFIDSLYDQYKTIQISPQNFHFIFQCFGKSTINIANDAFDDYMNSRDADLAWKNSIATFLCTYLFFEKKLAETISNSILKSIP
ncbi:hypothetical protein E9993_21540 [Labilibacter sediminis]|nr:hypothetical protein E9993_21540 [Labilibacter sediminis]